jgi:hypothetical protein
MKRIYSCGIPLDLSLMVYARGNSCLRIFRLVSINLRGRYYAEDFPNVTAGLRLQNLLKYGEAILALLMISYDVSFVYHRCRALGHRRVTL